MNNILFRWSLLAGLGVLMVGCGDSGNGCPSGQVPCDGVCIDAVTPTLGGANGVQAGVFTPSCTFTNCHGSMGAAQAGLELSSVAISEENLIGVDSTQVPTALRVTAGDSGASYIMNKLLGEGMAPDTLQMPVGSMLCEARLQAVRQWIDDGAPVQ